MQIVLFDGECNLCNGAVQFLIKRDRNQSLHFASLQSEIGEALLTRYKLPMNLSSMVYIKNNKAYVKSSAAIHIGSALPGLWKLITVFIILPKGIRDPLYEFIARNRYKWFGKQKTCMLPTPETKSRFLTKNDFN